SAIQGAHGGGKAPRERFTCSYKTLGKHLGRDGGKDAVRSRVRARLKKLNDWQDATGFKLFDIFKGGKVIGRDDDGNEIHAATEFIDYLLPAADSGVERARKTNEWKRHPGIAMQAQVASVLAELPRTEARAKIEKPKAAPAP